MKKKSIWLRLVILLVLAGAVVTLLEVYDLHPEFNVGRFHSLWVGVEHMEFGSGTVTAPGAGGKKMVQRDYDLGPVKVAILAAKHN